MKKALFIIAPSGFQDHEFIVPYNLLTKNNIKTHIAASATGLARGKFGLEVNVDYLLTEVDATDYDALIFIGGPGATSYQENKNAHKLILDAMEASKILAAICIAPTILASSGALEGKKATVWNGDHQQSDYLESHGAHFTASSVTVDGNIITANGPQAAEEFAETILEKINNI